MQSAKAGRVKNKFEGKELTGTKFWLVVVHKVVNFITTSKS